MSDAAATLKRELAILPRESTTETAIAVLDLLAAVASPVDRLALERARRALLGEALPRGGRETDDSAALARIMASPHPAEALHREAVRLAGRERVLVDSVRRRLQRKLDMNASASAPPCDSASHDQKTDEDRCRRSATGTAGKN